MLRASLFAPLAPRPLRLVAPLLAAIVLVASAFDVRAAPPAVRVRIEQPGDAPPDAKTPPVDLVLACDDPHAAARHGWLWTALAAAASGGALVGGIATVAAQAARGARRASSINRGG